MVGDDAYQLNVNYGSTSVGTLVLDKVTNLPQLRYAKQWQHSGFAISPYLPLDNRHSPEVAYNYLDNVLPEGQARTLLAESLGVSEKNVYSQVQAIGNDLAGAVTFNLTNHRPGEHKPIFRELPEAELIARLNHKDEFGILTWDDKPRLSVAGVQHKLNVFIAQDGRMGFGDGSLSSTHIVKFEKAKCPNLVLNEFFCMKLSKAVGLPTADAVFRRFGPHPALIVKRFDRKYDSDNTKVFKRHVIDGCQALNLPRDYKYERNLGDGRDVQHIRDGASLPKLFKFCRNMASPVSSIQWLIQWQLFNLMISNYDSHGKNVSLYFERRQAQFTPAYDLVNIAMFPQFKHALAMAMGDEFEPNNIHAYQLADFAETCGINKKLLSRLLTELANKVLTLLAAKAFLDSLQGPDISAEDSDYFEALRDNIVARTQYLRAQSADISSIVV